MDLIDNIGSKKVFTKMDLCWGFNNVRIKERNEQKEVFTIHMESFKPIVMFFGITNSPATFQKMINEGKVVAFVNDMLVGIEIEEEYDEIIDKILRKLEKNGLYVKPEKCV